MRFALFAALFTFLASIGGAAALVAEVTSAKACALGEAVRFGGDYGQVWIGNDADAYFPVLTGRPPVFTTGDDANFSRACRSWCESEHLCFNWCFAAQRPNIGGTCYFFGEDAARLAPNSYFVGGSCNHTHKASEEDKATVESEARPPSPVVFDVAVGVGLVLLLCAAGAVLTRARRRMAKSKQARDLEEGCGDERQAEAQRSCSWMEALSENATADDLRSLVSQPALWGMTVDQLVGFYNEHRCSLEAYCRDHLVSRKGVHVCRWSPCPHNHGCARFRTQLAVEGAPSRGCQDFGGDSGSMQSTTASQEDEDLEGDDDEEDEDEDILEPLKLTMHVVVDVIIKPRTREADGILGFAPLLNRQNPLRASIFVSHCWSEVFADFVRTLETHLPATSVVWICSFALPQNRDIYKMVSQGDLWQCPFAKALVQADRVVVVVDERVLPLERIWCLYEMYICVTKQIRMDVRAPTMSKSLFRTILSKADGMDIRDCSSTSEEDKDRILNEVAGAEETVNSTVRQNIEELVRLMESVQE